MSTPHPLPRPKCKSLMGLRIVGTGKYLPERVVPNEELFDLLHFAEKNYTTAWIVKGTGIHERRNARPDQATSDLCVEAAQDCFAKSGIDPKDIDLLVLGTFTPDMSFPSTACIVQDKLKLVCAAVEVEAACAGFMYALITAAAYVASGASERALVIGGDVNSRILSTNDPKIYPLFGDGAGAVILERGTPEQGIVAYSLGSDGSGGKMLHRPACGSRMPPTADSLAAGLQYMHMDGNGVYRWAIEILRDTVNDVCTAAKIPVEAIDLFCVHQANIRIIEQSLHKWLDVKPERVFNNLEKYGNTSAGSIPIALDEALAAGKLNRGQLALFSGFGAGLAWGTALIRW
ncbi:ketoacyl-ACP synthase III [soil metagenome]